MDAMTSPPHEYVLARAVLLDALYALGPHLHAVVLVGAQAVYLHTGDADLAIAPTTTDADLALSPVQLLDEPLLEDALRNAGFELAADPGAWRGRFGVAVDLMVPEALIGAGGRRSLACRSTATGPHGGPLASNRPWSTTTSTRSSPTRLTTHGPSNSAWPGPRPCSSRR